MEKVLCASAVVKDYGIVLDYYIVCSSIGLDDGISIISYGVEIQKNSTQSAEMFESKVVYDVCLSEKQMASFVQLLCENTVTPTTLYDIVSDKIEEGYFEPAYPAIKTA